MAQAAQIINRIKYKIGNYKMAERKMTENSKLNMLSYKVNY